MYKNYIGDKILQIELLKMAIKRWRGKWGRWSTRGSSKLESGDRTGFPPSHKWRVALEATVCSGCYHAHFVLCNDSFIQGDVYLALQGQSAPAPTSCFFLRVLFSFQNLTFVGGVCMCVCVCFRDSKTTQLPLLMSCMFLSMSACCHCTALEVELVGRISISLSTRPCNLKKKKK